MIAKDPNIKGIITLRNRKSIIMLYADDTNIMVRDKDSVGNILAHLETYYRASGTIINTGKSEIMYCSPVIKTHNRWQFHRNHR